MDFPNEGLDALRPSSRPQLRPRSGQFELEVTGDGASVACHEQRHGPHRGQKGNDPESCEPATDKANEKGCVLDAPTVKGGAASCKIDKVLFRHAKRLPPDGHESSETT